MLTTPIKEKQNSSTNKTTPTMKKKSIVRVMNTDKFECPYCPATYTQSIMLDKHVRIHMNQLFHKCVYCDQLFALKGEMEKHQIIHTGPMPFPCSYCDYNFPEERDVIEHEKKTHSSSSLKSQSSSILHQNLVPRKYAIQKSTTISHKHSELIKSQKNKSAKQKRFRPNRGGQQCPICKKWVSVLSRHMNIHTQSKSWFCSFCQKEFNQRHNMLRHENSIHTGAKKYCCPNKNCTKQYMDRRSLKNHIASKKCVEKQ